MAKEQQSTTPAPVKQPTAPIENPVTIAQLQAQLAAANAATAKAEAEKIELAKTKAAMTDRETKIAAKVALGLEREQAIATLNHQDALDRIMAEEAKKMKRIRDKIKAGSTQLAAVLAPDAPVADPQHVRDDAA